GSSRRGLARIDFRDGHPSVSKLYDVQDGLPDFAVAAVHETRDGALWVGTGRAGLAEIRGLETAAPKVVRTYSESLGGKIGSITEDRTGDLWLARVNAGATR